MRRIGLDVGGVITDAIGNDGTDTDFRGDNFMATSAVEGAYESIKTLVGSFGSGNVVIVSKCGEVIEARTRLWLEGTGFYRFTEFDPANLFFCRTRAEKTPIAASLQLTDFVDDHADVLIPMDGIVDRRYLFGPQSDEVQNARGLVIVDTWVDTLAAIMK